MFPFRSLSQAALSVVRLFLSIAEVICKLCLFPPLLLLDYLQIQLPEPAQDESRILDTGQLSLIKAAIDDMEHDENTALKASEAEASPDSASVGGGGRRRKEGRKKNILRIVRPPLRRPKRKSLALE